VFAIPGNQAHIEVRMSFEETPIMDTEMDEAMDEASRKGTSTSVPVNFHAAQASHPA
jgi:hypothetical protein